MFKVTKEQALQAQQVLAPAKLTKIEAATDKLKVVKVLRQLDKVREEFDETRKSLIEKMKGEKHDEYQKKLDKWQQEEQAKKEITLSEEERIELNVYFQKYNKDVQEALDKEAKEEVEIEADKLTQEIADGIIKSNEDLTTRQIVSIFDVTAE